MAGTNDIVSTSICNFLRSILFETYHKYSFILKKGDNKNVTFIEERHGHICFFLSFFLYQNVCVLNRQAPELCRRQVGGDFVLPKTVGKYIF